VSQALSVTLPAACSPRDGVWLLVLQLEAQLEGLEHAGRLLRDRAADEAAGLLAEKRELHWRLRAILDAHDARDLRLGGTRAALVAACGLTDLVEAPPSRPGLFAGRRALAARLDRLEALEQRFHATAAELRRRFPEDRFHDAFRTGAQLADAHLERWQTLRGALS